MKVVTDNPPAAEIIVKIEVPSQKFFSRTPLTIWHKVIKELF
jgi:hypothetical protein